MTNDTNTRRQFFNVVLPPHQAARLVVVLVH
jgi:hypothetical protein